MFYVKKKATCKKVLQLTISAKSKNKLYVYWCVDCLFLEGHKTLVTEVVLSEHGTWRIGEEDESLLALCPFVHFELILCAHLSI